MVIRSLQDKVLLPKKKDVLRVHLYFKLIQHGVKPFENDMDIMIELYQFGGYTNSEEQSRFIDLCIKKKLKKSAQSVRNTLSKYVNMGIFQKPKNTTLHINPNFLPKVECDKLVLQHMISHAE
jgi:hypothetical protein